MSRGRTQGRIGEGLKRPAIEWCPASGKEEMRLGPAAKYETLLLYRGAFDAWMRRGMSSEVTALGITLTDEAAAGVSGRTCRCGCALELCRRSRVGP
ncbi:hypothetical protein NDU88_001431 [Pleurodeles waltl]|uniref:Uncharacterized protein n=1 Tax=Pleurodeles waltl TaxID=8319 RepID=A0AAV7MJQ5_PLEWA|nr:hypothetical protein NDU88_001431 [Pleurodeles waltl]